MAGSDIIVQSAGTAATASAAAIPASSSTVNGATTVVTAAGNAFTPNAFIIHLFGQDINLMSVLIIMMFVGLLTLFIRIQLSGRLDFADMITMDGRKVSLSKVLQLIGGSAATWVIIKMGAVGTLTAEVFGIYLAYVGGVEGFSKFLIAKYGYSETSVKDGGAAAAATDAKRAAGADSDAQTALKSAVDSATNAEASARDAKVSGKNALVELNTNSGDGSDSGNADASDEDVDVPVLDVPVVAMKTVRRKVAK